ncbi:hypothetical protein DVH24_038987 [Malus domestica]|uniref:AT-hook motif nuclear-localized protein n=1 Tax=Malus domestica TaxID=3750 RepID=A0A498KGV5_MALDO|nr:hypothetical protein DVH24_038987 [Malus domestica]
MARVILSSLFSPFMQGPFQILSLSGTFVYGSTRNPLEKSWMINVLLANHDGKAFGGSVAGFMIAAEPVQVSHLIGANSINPASPPSFGQNVNPASLSGFGQNVNPASPPDFGQNVNPASPPGFNLKFNPASLPGFGQNVPQSMLGPGTSIDFIPFVP